MRLSKPTGASNQWSIKSTTRLQQDSSGKYKTLFPPGRFTSADYQTRLDNLRKQSSVSHYPGSLANEQSERVYMFPHRSHSNLNVKRGKNRGSHARISLEQNQYTVAEQISKGFDSRSSANSSVKRVKLNDSVQRRRDLKSGYIQQKEKENLVASFAQIGDDS